MEQKFSEKVMSCMEVAMAVSSVTNVIDGVGKAIHLQVVTMRLRVAKKYGVYRSCHILKHHLLGSSLE